MLLCEIRASGAAVRRSRKSAAVRALKRLEACPNLASAISGAFLRAHNATLSRALDGTGFGQALPEL
jgi:hypothetical protein